MMPVSSSAKYLDPCKLVVKYEGPSDYRTPVGFIREFEQYTSNIQDKIRGKLFVSRMNTAKFRMARSYTPALGYRELKKQFLAAEWDESARENALRKIDAMKYDPAKYSSRAEFLAAIFEQLYDCQISTQSLFNKIMRHCPFYSGVITEWDCEYFEDFAAKVRMLQSRFGDQVNDPNLGFAFNTPRTPATPTSGPAPKGKAGAFMISPPGNDEESFPDPYVMHIGGNFKSNRNAGGNQTYETSGNEFWR